MGEVIQFPGKHSPGRVCTSCVHAFIGVQGLYCDVYNDLMQNWAADDCPMWEDEVYDGGEL